MDEKPSAVDRDIIQVDSGDSDEDGPFSEPLHMTKAVYESTFIGIGGIIRENGKLQFRITKFAKTVGDTPFYFKN